MSNEQNAYNETVYLNFLYKLNLRKKKYIYISTLSAFPRFKILKLTENKFFAIQ